MRKAVSQPLGVPQGFYFFRVKRSYKSGRRKVIELSPKDEKCCPLEPNTNARS